MDTFLCNNTRVETCSIGNCNVTVRMNWKQSTGHTRARVCMCASRNSLLTVSALNRNGKLRTGSAGTVAHNIVIMHLLLIQFFKFIVNAQTIMLWFDLRFLFLWRCGPARAMVSSFLGFFEIRHDDTPQSVGLLWTSDQLVADTSALQHTTFTADEHPCPRQD